MIDLGLYEDTFMCNPKKVTFGNNRRPNHSWLAAYLTPE